METEQQTRTAGASPRRQQGEAAGEHALPLMAVRGDAYDTSQTGKTNADGMANFLGWFSIGLGMVQVVAPDAISRLIGVEESNRNNEFVRAMGMREISHGVAILANPRPEKAVWSRVAGDMLDLAVLGKIAANPENDRSRTLGATLAVLGVTALDLYCAKQLSRIDEDAVAVAHEPGIFTKRAITINKPLEEVYAYWRNFENLPTFMRHLESVHIIDERRSHWVARAPAGQTVEWDATITEERENELIAWESDDDAFVYNEGSVRFAPAPGGRGTEVRVDLRYEPPGGVLGSKIAMLWREEPGQQVQDDLRRFKQMMEIGEVTISDATYKRGMHPAVPPAEV